MATTASTDAEYANNWIGPDWIVTQAIPQVDPHVLDILRFKEDSTQGRTIEIWRLPPPSHVYNPNGPHLPPSPTQVGPPWATGCTWSNNSLQGTTSDGAHTFVITRNEGSLECRFTDNTARLRRIGGALLAAFSGVLAGFLTGMVLRVSVTQTLAIGGAAAGLCALVAGGMPATPTSADLWVANEGGSNGPPDDTGGIPTK